MTVTVDEVLATQLRLSCGHFVALQRRGSHQGLLGAAMTCRQCEGLKPFVWAKPRLAPRADKRVGHR